MIKHKHIADQFMLPVDWDKAPSKVYPFITSEKLNGIGCRYFPGEGFFTKHGVRWSRDVLAHIQTPMMPVKGDIKHWVEAPVCGELWAPNMSLQEIASAVGVIRDTPGPRAEEVRLYINDLAILGLAFQRVAQIAHVRGDGLEYMRFEMTRNRAELEAQLDAVRRRGGEGLVLRSMLSQYTGGKTNTVLKIKLWKDEEADVIGANEGVGELSGMLGSFIVRLESGATVSVGIGDGLTRAKRIEYWTNRPRRIRIQYLTTSDTGVPQNPSFLCVEDDI